MKIVSRDEREAHASHLVADGARGLIYGTVVSVGLYSYLKHKHPQKFGSFNASIKTSVLIMPTIAITAFWADQGSVEFDKKMHSLGGKEKMLEEYAAWKKQLAVDKVLGGLNSVRYPILLSLWCALLLGAWKLEMDRNALGGRFTKANPRGMALVLSGLFGLAVAGLYYKDYGWDRKMLAKMGE